MVLNPVGVLQAVSLELGLRSLDQVRAGPTTLFKKSSSTSRLGHKSAPVLEERR